MSRYLDSKNSSAINVVSATLTAEATSTQNSILAIESDYAQLLTAWQTKIADGTRLKTVPADMKPSLSELPDTDTGVMCSLSGKSSLPANCTFGNVSASRTAVILGDSFARAIYPMVINALDLQEWHIIPITQGACMVADVVPWLNGAPFTECVQHRDRAFELIDKIRPDILILADNAETSISQNGRLLADSNQVWESGLAESISRLTKSATKTIYFGTPSAGPSLIDCVGSNDTLSSSCFFDSIKREYFRSRQSRAIVSTGNLFIDPTDWMCLRICPQIIDNTPVFWDGLHIAPTFAEKLGPLFRAYLKSNDLL
jgi:hypothetical protein